MINDYKEVIQHDHPMASARLVRRDAYAWPGGYQLALVTTDGGMLCPACVKAEYHQIAWSHRNNVSDGWQPACYTVLYDGETLEQCDHCNAILATGPEDETTCDK